MEISASGETSAVSFEGASVAQVIKMLQDEDQLDTLTIMIGTIDNSKAPVTPGSRWEPLLICLSMK